MLETAFVENNAIAGDGAQDQPARGGAIYVTGGTVEIAGASFSSNRVVGGASQTRFPAAGGIADGGALCAENGTTIVSTSTFSMNSATARSECVGRGGAISVIGGTIEVRDTSLQDNIATGGQRQAERGGGAFLPGFAGEGRAIYLGSGAAAKVETSLFLQNKAAGGPATYFYRWLGGPAYGGAILNDGTLSMANSTLEGNSAINEQPEQMADGGAVFNRGTAGLTNVTLRGNVSVGPALKSETGTLTLKNSLLLEHEGTVGGAEIIDAGHNLSSESTPVFTQPTSQNGVDANALPLGDYGGPTRTIALAAGSPAINSGDDSNAPAVDQRGRARPYGGQSDIGAYESVPPFHIFGKLTGYVHPSATIHIGETDVEPDSSGAFVLYPVNEGGHTVSVTAENSLFKPTPAELDVEGDMRFEARGFAFHAFGFDPAFAEPTYNFAGKTGEEWDFQISTDLVQWSLLAGHHFTADSLFSLPLEPLQAPVFLKATLK